MRICTLQGVRYEMTCFSGAGDRVTGVGEGEEGGRGGGIRLLLLSLTLALLRTLVQNYLQYIYMQKYKTIYYSSLALLLAQLLVAF